MKKTSSLKTLAKINPFNRIKNYFIGDVLARENDHLSRANYLIVYYSCALSVTLLVPLQFVYLTKNVLDIDQILIGLASIIFFGGGLFYLKSGRPYHNLSVVLIGFSIFSFSTGLWLYPDYSMISGLHLCVNVIFSIYLLKPLAAKVMNMIQAASLLLYWYTYSKGLTIWFLEPIVQPLIERVFAVSILISLIALIIYHYRNAHLSAAKQLNESLDKVKSAQRVAEEMNQLKSRFLANMSHEIRTPLNGILGITEILKESNTDPEVLEFLEIQNRSGYRLLNTIDGILSLSRLEVKSEFFELSEVDLSQITEEVIRNQSAVIAERQIEIKRDYKSANCLVKVDENIMFQVITNLLNNALKFSDPNSQIEIKIEDAERSELMFSVSDNGIGISPDFLDRIFEPFERDEANLTSKQPGSGLGLSITKKFVELMGGRISVQSELNIGSVFMIMLPRKDESY